MGLGLGWVDRPLNAPLLRAPLCGANNKAFNNGWFLFQYRKNIEIVGKYRCKKNVRNVCFAIDPIEAGLGCTTCIDRCLWPYDIVKTKFLIKLGCDDVHKSSFG